MPDVIHLLPDLLANQIAAGEVVQRPASVVKELIENAVDAGAKNIRIIIRDSGRELIQVVDDGSGMSELDARKCFERHATSKIKTSGDLFNIVTKGFRGEALASIAAVAQVDLKTRMENEESGTLVRIENSRILLHEACTMNTGTSISVKNLFYNIPARRNFLKSNAVEFGHIVDEFHRVALAHPELSFILEHSGVEHTRAVKTHLRQRIVQLMGSGYQSKLVPLKEETDLVSIEGFLVKPEHARKSRGEQFFFVNNRFIKSSYLHHAIAKGYEQLISAEQHPGYFLFIKVDPSSIDVNIHPTKTEIKFNDEKAIYAILRSAVRRSLAIFNLTPSLDFEIDPSIAHLPKPEVPPPAPGIMVNLSFNPFERESKKPASTGFSSGNRSLAGIQPNTGFEQEQRNTIASAPFFFPSAPEESSSPESDSFPIRYMSLDNNLFISRIKTGLMIIHSFRALQRIAYEQFLQRSEQSSMASQQMLFPIPASLSTSHFSTLSEHQQIIRQLGYTWVNLGAQQIHLTGTPASMRDEHAVQSLEQVLEEATHAGAGAIALNPRDYLAKLYARTIVAPGKKTDEESMQRIVDQLFACSEPYFCPFGKPLLYTISQEELEQRLI